MQPYYQQQQQQQQPGRYYQPQQPSIPQTPSLNAASSTAASQSLKRRSCAEVCLELLTAEAVQLFSNGQPLDPASAAALEAVGVRTGRALAERYTRDKLRLVDTLEIIKYLCKEFWTAVFKKQVDNLRTNHRGVYVLQDNSFRWLQRFAPMAAAAAADPAQDEALKHMAMSHLHLPCGIIRGALCQLGIICTVEADPKALPACVFTVKITA